MPSSICPPHIPDDSRNLSQWIQYTAERVPECPLFAYASSGDSRSTHIVTWSQTRAAVERAAFLVESTCNLTASTVENRSSKPLVIGLLANLDTITYNAIYLGILRAGGTAFLISSRNSPTAVAHLLERTGTHTLFVSPDEPIQTLVSAALALPRNQGHYDHIAVHIAPDFQTLFEHNETRFAASRGLKADIDVPAVIIHSSGSTSFPKPITLTHRKVLEWTNLIELTGIDLSKTRFAIHALPVYHAMGFFATFWAVRTGLTLTVFPPHLPPVVPSHSSFLDSAVASQSTFMLCVPLFLELWSREPASIAQLKTFRGVVFGGGPLNKAVGDELLHQGVLLTGLYGATEIGAGAHIVPRDLGDDEWDWFQLSRKVNAKFLPQDDPGLFELVYVDCATHHPVPNCTVDSKNAFSTNDIVIRHPTDPQKFKILGRKDDQIMLSSGEKTNPGPIEAIICKHAFVEAAVMFGRGRDRNGIIIQPAKGHEFDPADAAKLYQFRKDILSSIEEANEFSPGHSRLSEEMIIVTCPSRPIEMTSKHTPRKGATIEAYKDEIEALYHAVQASFHSETMPLSAWKYTEVLEYVRKVVLRAMHKTVKDDMDIFEKGCDSLQATYIRNTLFRVIGQNFQGIAVKMPQNFVYANPSIVQLAERLLSIADGTSEPSDDAISFKLREIEGIIAEFSTHFPNHQPRVAPKSFPGEVVLLTGTTGGLGSQLLSLLACSPDISLVYALNRRSASDPRSLRDRQADAFRERGLDANLVFSSKVTLVEGDTATDKLDVDPILYFEIRDRITLIIHNAWKVNFNLGLGSFKRSIRGVRTLIDLALGSPRENPPRIIYISSVGVFRNWNTKNGRPLETSIDDPKVVLGNGYGESKFVGERILEQAAKSTSLCPVIVRIGQMTGTPSGAWNPGDWVPAMVRSGQVVKALPARSDHIAWISLATAAKAIFDFRHSESQYLHLAHPNPVPWSTVFDVFSSRLKVPLISWNDWLARLEGNDEGGEKNPAVHLLDFFRECAPASLETREAPGIPLMDLTQALKFSASLTDSSLSQINCHDAERWLRYWEAVGLLSDNIRC